VVRKPTDSVLPSKILVDDSGPVREPTCDRNRKIQKKSIQCNCSEDVVYLN